MSSSDVAAMAVPLCDAVLSTPPAVASLQLRLRFSEGAGTTTANGALTGGTATVAGTSVWRSASQPCDPAFPTTQMFVQFDGPGDYVVLPKPAAADFGATTSFSVALYFSSLGAVNTPSLVRVAGSGGTGDGSEIGGGGGGGGR